MIFEESYITRIPKEHAIWKHIDLALKIACDNPHMYKMGCVILDDQRKIIAQGMNRPTKTHPLQAKYAMKVNKHQRIFLHAEIDALIRSIKSSTQPETLIVVRMRRDGVPGTSKPCVVCREAIRQTMIRQVVYFDGEEFVMELRN